MLGIDIISISRFQKIAKSDFKHWDKFFHKLEWDYCFSRPNPSQSLAGIFSAKEAVIKATGEKGWLKIKIIHSKNYRPIAKIGRKIVQISISHEKKYAVAAAFKV